MILSVERARIYVASISYVANISNGCPISPAFCLVAVTAGDIALIDGDIRCEDSVQTVFTVVHLVCEPVQLTGVGDLVCAVAIAILCRLIVGGVVLAETVGIKVVLHNRHRIRPVFKIILCQCRTADNSNRQ